MTVRELTTEEIVLRSSAFMKRSKTSLVHLANLMGLDTTGSKTDLVARIILHSGAAEVEPKHFDMTGFYIRTGCTVEAGQ